ncbi:MAG: type IV secretion system DNA-binding domain-containing protein [Gammaproteobacteria bacterium]|nr:type IV secretion system DNA-binding domain-containing protein [Gammaproteobacteria bacterium]
MHDQTYIGQREVWNSEMPLSLWRGARRRHLFIVGQTSTGKSTLFRNLMSQDIEAGSGCALIDPHGDLAQEVMDAVPKRRLHDTLVLDPSDTEHPVGINPFFMVPPNERSLVASNLTAIFKKQWGDSWGPRLEYILHNINLALLEAPPSLRPTILSIPLMLVEPNYRNKVVSCVRDYRVRSFFDDEFARWKGRDLEERIGPLQNKVGKLLSNPFVRNMFGQWNPAVNFDEVISKRKILIVRLAKGLVGEEEANLFGSIVASSLMQSSMRRADLPEAERHDFYLHIDEFPNFTTNAFAGILSEARKYGLALTCGNQYLSQMSDEIRDAVFGNVGSMVVFRVGAEDAEFLAKEFGGVYPPARFRDLRIGEVAVRLLGQDGNTTAFGKTDPNGSACHGTLQQVVEHTRRRYGLDRSTVEATIGNWLGKQIR